MHDLIIKQGLYSCLYIYMHMHCCLFTLLFSSLFFCMPKSSFYLFRGDRFASHLNLLLNLNLYFFPQKPRIHPTFTYHASQRL